MYFTLLVVVILTAIALVAVALGIARAISPRSYNSQKGEAYECGIPTRGRSWMQFKVGYYLFAIQSYYLFHCSSVHLRVYCSISGSTSVLSTLSHSIGLNFSCNHWNTTNNTGTIKIWKIIPINIPPIAEAPKVRLP